ncbi:MAG: hypothetical protein GKS00_24995 [Alphaproteobacteria bacterium]|nr:hypothetical protein [Alphaproteobacteria bacterium]
MDADRRELTQLLFVEATARIEAALECAIAGQSAELAAADYVSVARRLRAVAHNLAALADAALVIAGKPDDDPRGGIEASS